LVSPATALLSIDQSSGLFTHLWARSCIRTSKIPPDELAGALNAMHAQALDDIRADRPVEAAEGMQALCDLHQVIWDAYAAYGRTYDLDAVQGFHLFRPTTGERIAWLLDDELRAAAVSGDTKIRREATLLPRRLARVALPARAAATIRQILQTLLGVYDAVVSDLTDDGQQTLPPGGTARTRLHAPFHSLLSFTTSDLQRAIDQPTTLGRGAGPAPAADMQAAAFAVAQLQPVHRQLLEMLKHAARLRDIATVRAALGRHADAGCRPHPRRAQRGCGKNAAHGTARHGTAPRIGLESWKLSSGLAVPWTRRGTTWTHCPCGC